MQTEFFPSSGHETVTLSEVYKHQFSCVVTWSPQPLQPQGRLAYLKGCVSPISTRVFVQWAHYLRIDAVIDSLGIAILCSTILTLYQAIKFDADSVSQILLRPDRKIRFSCSLSFLSDARPLRLWLHSLYGWTM